MITELRKLLLFRRPLFFHFLIREKQNINRLLEIALFSFLLTFAACFGPDKKETSCRAQRSIFLLPDIITTIKY